MPMLERKAASLEPCHLQRVLPPKKTPFKSTRRLHIAFWQHGAADIELSNVWQLLFHEPLESSNPLSTLQFPNGTKNDSVGASTFLLDFLYPQGATSLLRKLAPSVLDKHERPRLYLRGAVPRLFSSTVSPSQKSRDPDGEADTRTAVEMESDQGGDTAQEKDALEGSNGVTPASVGDSTSQDGIAAAKLQFRDVTPHIDNPAGDARRRDEVLVQTRQISHIKIDEATSPQLKAFRDLLRKGQASTFHSIWKKFHDLDEPKELQSQFIEFVMKHRSMTHLLVTCLCQGHWWTFRTLWAQYPEGHREDAKAINWKEFEQVSGLDRGPAPRYKYVSQDEPSWGPRRPVSLKSSNGKVMPGLAFLIKQIHRSAKAHTPEKDREVNRTLLTNFIYPIIDRYHLRLGLTNYTNLPKLLEDPLLYELFLQHTVMDPKYRALSSTLYKEYRVLPGVKIRGHVMRAMVHHVYKPVEDAEGMEMVLQDLYRRFPRLDMNLYRAFMLFYARRSDVKTTQRLFDEYRSHFAAERKLYHSEDTERRDPDFTHLLQLYAVRGELGEARRIFAQAQADFGPTLTTKCWNILLQAHAVAHDYEAAIRVFSVMRQAVTVDQYSYSTIMGMAGIRGDLEFTLELYRMAKGENVAPNVFMVDAVVEAYCQNDRFREAERIVQITTTQKRFEKSELSKLWNSMLWHHAHRRDLKTLRATLNQMVEASVPYKSETYAHLLRALAWCRQPHHALFMMNHAYKTKSFKPTLEHYTLLMSAFLWTGQYEEMLRTSTILRTLGMPQTGDLLLRCLQALGAWATKKHHVDGAAARTRLVSMLRQYRESIERSQKSVDHLPRRRLNRQPPIDYEDEPITVRQRAEHTNTLIHTFTLMRQAADVPEILKLWASSSPEASTMPEPPLRLLHALMHAAFYEGEHDEVRRIWKQVFARAVQKSRVSGPSTQRDVPVPSMRYMLCDPLKTMQRLHGVTDDPDGLRETVSSVLQAGFRLDSKNWNYYVQLLANLKRWREAFFVCEEHLMPNWRGWARVPKATLGASRELPFYDRRMGSHPHNVRPTAYTLATLTKAYMDLRKMAVWSGDAERLLVYIEKHCVVSVNAVKAALRGESTLKMEVLQQISRPKDARDISNEKLAMAEAEAREAATVRVEQARIEGLDEDSELPRSFQEMMETIIFDDTPTSSSDQDDFGSEDGAQATNLAGDSDHEGAEEDWRDMGFDDESWVPMAPYQTLAASGDAHNAPKPDHSPEESTDPQNENRGPVGPDQGPAASAVDDVRNAHTPDRSSEENINPKNENRVSAGPDQRPAAMDDVRNVQKPQRLEKNINPENENRIPLGHDPRPAAVDDVPNVRKPRHVLKETVDPKNENRISLGPNQRPAGIDNVANTRKPQRFLKEKGDSGNEHWTPQNSAQEPATSNGAQNAPSVEKEAKPKNKNLDPTKPDQKPPS